MKYAVLLHCVDWQLSCETSADLDGGVKICKFEGSAIEQIYHRLCSDYGVDEGDPFRYLSYLLIEPQHDRITFDMCGVENDVAQLCNAMTICFGGHVGLSRFLPLNDSLQYAGGTEIVHNYTDASFVLYTPEIAITRQSHKQIKLLWSSVRNLRDNYESNRRLNTALSFFNYAWRGFYLGQVCINLSIVLEALFSPSSTTELAHQISYNTCYFLGKNTDERSRIYRIIKQFYSVRSKLVHGDWPNDAKLSGLTPQVFVLCADILQRILLDPVLLQKFSNNKERLEMFNQWLFQ